jgi:diaminopimelate epimerase
MTALHLSKLHATGNDFLVRLVLDREPSPLPPRTVARLCDRRRGIGADGFITIGPGAPEHGVDCTMTLQNADGGDAEMSGNGIRCLAWVAARAGLGTNDELAVQTAAGKRIVSLTRDASGTVIAADVDMGAVTLGDEDLEIEVDGVEYWGDVASVGNPHLVCFVIDPAVVPVATHGPRIELDARFPQRTNVEFVRVRPPDVIDMRVWERGVGETLSCGTGACAAVAVAHNRGVVEDRVQVRVPGGELLVTLGPTVRLGGPVEHVFDVDIHIDADADADPDTAPGSERSGAQTS